MKNLMVYSNPVTKAFIYSYRPIRFYIYDYSMFPYSALNPLAKVFLFQDSVFGGGEHLFEVCTDPNIADLFLLPCDLDFFEHREQLIFPLIPFYSNNETRHVFYDTRDDPEPFPSGKSIYLKPSLHKKSVSDSVICIPYLETVDDFFTYFIQSRTIKYELSFIGQRTPLRENTLRSLEDSFDTRYFLLRDGFFFRGQFLSIEIEKEKHGLSHMQRGDSGESWRVEYIETMRQSKFVLALPGYALNTFRFFEALSLGIPPVLVSDNAALPFEDNIQYDKFCIRVDTSSPSISADIKSGIKKIGPEQYAEMCLLARLHYDTFLSRKTFLFLIYDALKKLV